MDYYVKPKRYSSGKKYGSGKSEKYGSQKSERFGGNGGIEETESQRKKGFNLSSKTL